jgi:hypothetical protein
VSTHILSPLAVNSKSERKVDSLPLLGFKPVIFGMLVHFSDHSAKSTPDYDCVLFVWQKNVHSKAFVKYVSEQALPVLDQLASPDDQTNVQLDLLKVYAEISEHAGELENHDACVDKLYSRLLVGKKLILSCVYFTYNY